MISPKLKKAILDQLQLAVAGASRRAVKQPKRAQDFVVLRHERLRPRRPESASECDLARLPVSETRHQRIRGNVRNDDPFFPKGGRATRTHTRTDLHAIDGRHERFWKAGPCAAPQATTVWINQ